jgi:hypothetical protein
VRRPARTTRAAWTVDASRLATSKLRIVWTTSCCHPIATHPRARFDRHAEQDRRRRPQRGAVDERALPVSAGGLGRARRAHDVQRADGVLLPAILADCCTAGQPPARYSPRCSHGRAAPRRITQRCTRGVQPGPGTHTGPGRVDMASHAFGSYGNPITGTGPASFYLLKTGSGG